MNATQPIDWPTAKIVALQLTNGRGDVGNLCGQHNAKNRQTLLTLLTGEKRPVAKCGIHALLEEFFKVAGIPNDVCAAGMDERLAEWLKEGPVAMLPSCTQGKLVAAPTGPVMSGEYSQSWGLCQEGDNNLVAGVFSDVKGGEPTAKANAKRLARCWNSHDELVAALEEVLEYRQDILNVGGHNTCLRAAAALANAKGTP